MRKMAEGLSLFFLIFVVFFSSNPVVIVSLSIDRNLASTVSTVTELQEPLVMGYSAPFGQLYDVSFVLLIVYMLLQGAPELYIPL